MIPRIRIVLLLLFLCPLILNAGTQGNSCKKAGSVNVVKIQDLSFTNLNSHYMVTQVIKHNSFIGSLLLYKITDGTDKARNDDIDIPLELSAKLPVFRKLFKTKRVDNSSFQVPSTEMLIEIIDSFEATNLETPIRPRQSLEIVESTDAYLRGLKRGTLPMGLGRNYLHDLFHIYGSTLVPKDLWIHFIQALQISASKFKAQNIETKNSLVLSNSKFHLSAFSENLTFDLLTILAEELPPTEEKQEIESLIADNLLSIEIGIRSLERLFAHSSDKVQYRKFLKKHLELQNKLEDLVDNVVLRMDVVRGKKDLKPQ